MKLTSTSGYAQQADSLFERYESRDPATIHKDFLPWFLDQPGRVLDVGAGTGRDAAYFAGQGHQVVAVEPVDELRLRAIKLHPEPGIVWLDDRLPSLTKVVASAKRFDLVLMNAVLMHLPPSERAQTVGVLSSLMAPSARLCLTLRHGPVPAGRQMFDVPGEEVIATAQACGLRCLLHTRKGSIQPENKKRAVEWTKLVLERPRS